VDDSSYTGRVTGTASGFLSGVSNIVFNYTNLLPHIYAANWPDVLAGRNGAVTAAVYGASAGGTSGAIIQYSNATYRTIVMGFPFETITNETTRATVMTKAMQFLGDASTPGAVKVTLLPLAVTNVARWIVNGTTNISGNVRGGLNPGTYQVTFSPLAGYITPSATSVVVTASATNVLTATYTPLSCSLSVTIQPAGAVSAGAQWRVNGGSWRASAAVETGLSEGAHTVSFSSVSGWTAPSDVSTATTNGTTNSLTATYVESAAPTSVVIINEPFNDAPTPPPGWIFNGADSYSSASYAGQAIPSVRFGSIGNSIVSPTFLGATNLTFWMRAVTSAGVGTFVIDQKIGGNWSTVGVITNPSNVGTTYSMTLSESATQIRFTWNKTTSNIALDDVLVTGVETASMPDTDGDGLPDWWEELYFDGPTAAHPDADPDGDGMTNWQEYIAGTDPTREDSALVMEPLIAQSGVSTDLIFQWPAVVGRVYSVWRATNAVSAYTQHMDHIAASPPLNSWTNPAPAALGTYYYQLRVRWPDQP